MMNTKTVINQIYGLFFDRPTSYPENVLSPKHKDAAQRAIVARFARGNSRLQQGKFITREEIDLQLEQGLEDASRYGD